MSPNSPSPDRIRLYNRQAQKYGRLRRKQKSYDHQWRRELLQKAHGQVLELSAGAGANFRFYPQGVSVMAVDVSSAMIEEAKAAARDEGVAAQFICSAVEELTLPPHSFDTVVSTLSLCAYDDPVAVAGRMGRWCKPGGRILLMEHGLARPPVLRWLQHRLDGLQYRYIGCHMDRDILRVVQEAGLTVVHVQRKLWGMIYLIEAHPPESRA
jgi:ubiquinone/menaquinone biosynthesis C-methylase UbiE